MYIVQYDYFIPSIQDKIGKYYNDFDLDMEFLKHADFSLCNRAWTEKPFDEFIKNEMFH